MGFYDELDNVYAKKGDVESFLNQRKRSIESQRGRDDPEYVLVLNEIGAYMQRAGRYTEASESFTNAIAVLEEDGTLPEELATARTNLASIHIGSKDYDEALRVTQ
jgi:tetratricopeptide (TPR) repeat protein